MKKYIDIREIIDYKTWKLYAIIPIWRKAMATGLQITDKTVEQAFKEAGHVCQSIAIAQTQGGTTIRYKLADGTPGALKCPNGRFPNDSRLLKDFIRRSVTDARRSNGRMEQTTWRNQLIPA